MHTFHYIGDRKLQHFYTVDVVDEDGSWVVYFNSRIHVNKRVRLPTSFSKDFSPPQVVRDHSTIKAISDRYGDVFVCECHHG